MVIYNKTMKTVKQPRFYRIYQVLTGSRYYLTREDQNIISKQQEDAVFFKEKDADKFLKKNQSKDWRLEKK